MSELSRAADHSPKSKHLNVTRNNVFDAAKTELFNATKIDYSNVAKT